MAKLEIHNMIIFETAECLLLVGHPLVHQASTLGASNDYHQLKRSKKGLLLTPLTLTVTSVTFGVETNTDSYLLYWR